MSFGGFGGGERAVVAGQRGPLAALREFAVMACRLLQRPGRLAAAGASSGCAASFGSPLRLLPAEPTRVWAARRAPAASALLCCAGRS